MSKTEELRGKIVEVLYGELTYRNYLAIPMVRHNADLKIDQFLKTCKESDMVFVDREAKFQTTHFHSDSYWEGLHPSPKFIHEQTIKEIEEAGWHKVEEIEK